MNIITFGTTKSEGKKNIITRQEKSSTIPKNQNIYFLCWQSVSKQPFGITPTESLTKVLIKDDWAEPHPICVRI